MQLGAELVDDGGDVGEVRPAEEELVLAVLEPVLAAVEEGAQVLARHVRVRPVGDEFHSDLGVLTAALPTFCRWWG